MKQVIYLIIFLFVFFFESHAQMKFVRVDTIQVINDSIPLKNAWAGGINYPMFCELDLNGDGIMDLVLFEPSNPPGVNHLMPFLNHGDSGKVSYTFAPEYIDKFPADLKGWLITADYNCDGRMDLFSLSSNYSGIMLYRNDFSTGTGLQFTKVKDPINSHYGNTLYSNIFASYVSVPAILDIDGDGDIDILTWYILGAALEYHHGLRADSGWSCDSIDYKWVTSCWGHFALNANRNYATFGINCRIGADTAMQWDRGYSRVDDSQSCICLYDQDGDIDKDALVGGAGDVNILYLRNDGSVSNDIMDYQDTAWASYDVPVREVNFPCAYYMDVNNDQRKDMIIAPRQPYSDSHGILYYKDVNLPNDTPVFRRQREAFLQDEMIDVGTTAAPAIYDYNCDGLPDLLIGNENYSDSSCTLCKGITLYKNIGTARVPEYKLVTRNFADLYSLNGLNGPFTLTFGDLDNDGDKDMIAGSRDGNIYYFENIAPLPCDTSIFAPPSGAYMGINVGNNSVPQLYDLDHDGLLDLIVGNQRGVIKFYKNTGSMTVPFFQPVPSKDTLGGIVTTLPLYSTGDASPALYNDHGIDKLLVGTVNGKLYVYDNITGNINGTYHLADSVINGEAGENIIPAIADLNNDTLPDLVVGNNSGGVSLYMNAFTNGIVEAATGAHFSIYPNPASDHLIVSMQQIDRGMLIIYNNLGQVVFNRFVVNKQSIPVNAFPDGVYMAHFISKETELTAKVVIIH